MCRAVMPDLATQLVVDGLGALLEYERFHAYMARVLAELDADVKRDVICFVDDSRANCDAGAAAGLRSILFEGDSAECRTALISEGFWELRV